MVEEAKLELTPEQEHELSVYLVAMAWSNRMADVIGAGRCWGCNTYIFHRNDCHTLTRVPWRYIVAGSDFPR